MCAVTKDPVLITMETIVGSQTDGWWISSKATTASGASIFDHHSLPSTSLSMCFHQDPFHSPPSLTLCALLSCGLSPLSPQPCSSTEICSGTIFEIALNWTRLASSDHSVICNLHCSTSLASFTNLFHFSAITSPFLPVPLFLYSLFFLVFRIQSYGFRFSILIFGFP